MNKCKCESERLAELSAKCSDLCDYEVADGRGCDGYVPCDVGIGGGDYVQIIYCLDCGTIQGNFPIAEEFITEATGQSGIDPTDAQELVDRIDALSSTEVEEISDDEFGRYKIAKRWLEER